MSKLIYSMTMSLDGFVSDTAGDFGWVAPDQEVHEFINELSRSIGTALYGRLIYETMVYWETALTCPGSRRSWLSTRGSGRRPTRSSTPQR